MRMNDRKFYEEAKNIDMPFSVFMDIYDTVRRITGVVLFIAWFVTWLLGILLDNTPLRVAGLVLAITNLFVSTVLLLVTRHFINKWLDEEEGEDE